MPARNGLPSDLLRNRNDHERAPACVTRNSNPTQRTSDHSERAFFGIGAYAAGLVFTHMGFSANHAWLAFGVALVAAAAVSMLVGWLSFYQGATPLYASVISLVLPIAMTQLPLFILLQQRFAMV